MRAYSGRSALDENRRKGLRRPLRSAIGDERLDQTAGVSADLVDRIVEGGQRNREDFRGLRVVEPDNRQIVGATQSPLPHRFDQPKGEPVVMRKNAGWTRWFFQNSPQRSFAFAGRRPLHFNPPRRFEEPRLAANAGETLGAILEGCGPARPLNLANDSMPPPGEMRGRESAAGLIVAKGRRKRSAGQTAHRKDDREDR